MEAPLSGRKLVLKFQKPWGDSGAPYNLLHSGGGTWIALDQPTY